MYVIRSHATKKVRRGTWDILLARDEIVRVRELLRRSNGSDSDSESEVLFFSSRNRPLCKFKVRKKPQLLSLLLLTQASGSTRPSKGLHGTPVPI